MLRNMMGSGGWGMMLTFLELAYMVDATQHGGVGWVGGVGCLYVFIGFFLCPASSFFLIDFLVLASKLLDAVVGRSSTIIYPDGNDAWKSLAEQKGFKFQS